MLDTMSVMAMAVRPARDRRRERAASKARSEATAKRRATVGLLTEGVHGAHGTQIFRGIGRGVGQAILGRAREATHGAAIGQQRKDDDRNGRQSQRRQRRAGHEHHGQRTDEHDEVAQGLAERRPGSRLDLRGIGRQPAHHLARVRPVVEGGAQGGEVPEHVGAQIGDDPLPQPVDGIHAPRARQRQHQADADERHEVAVDEDAVVGGEPHVDHAPHGHRHRQHGSRGDHEGDGGREHHAQMASKVRPQGEQRGQLRAAQRRGLGVRIGFRQRGGPGLTHTRGQSACGRRVRASSSVRDARSGDRPRLPLTSTSACPGAGLAV